MYDLGNLMVTVSGPDGTKALSGPETVKLGEELSQVIKGFNVRGEVAPAVLLDFAVIVNQATRASTSRSLCRSGAVADSGKSLTDMTGPVSAQTVKVSEAARLAGVSDRWMREQIQRGSVSALRGHRGALLVRIDSLAAWIDARNRKESETKGAA